MFDSNPASHDPVLLDPDRIVTMRAAATICGVSVDTIERRRKAGRLPNAHRDPFNGHGRWVLPIADLVAADLLDPARVRPAEMDVAHVAADDSVVVELRAQIAALQAHVDVRTEEVQYWRSLLAARDLV